MSTSSPRHPLLLLSCLYIVQGLPYGFQAKALPVLMRESGVSLTLIGLLGILALPWMLKIGWAPVVDRYHWKALGRRRSWIIPMQIGMALSALVAAAAAQQDQWTLVFLSLFFMNACAATQDIAVDGWAVQLLQTEQLGLGNAAQVSGFKVGMLLSGGVLLYAVEEIGTAGLFLSMSALITAVLVLVLRTSESIDTSTQSTSTKEIWDSLRRAVQHRSTKWLILIILSYKMGETLNDTMVKPFLIDSGFTASELGLMLGIWGMGFSIAGSFCGGFLAGATSLQRALWLTSCFRVLPLFGQYWLAVQPQIGTTQVYIVLYAEHFFGGALTTVLFALMMANVDKRFGATQFTAFATLEVIGKTPFGLVSGWLVERTSYATVFACGGGLSLLFLLLIPRLSPPSDDTPL